MLDFNAYYPDGTPMPEIGVGEPLAWAYAYERVKGPNASEANWRVGGTSVGAHHVSTVWIGHNLSYDPAYIEIFETMIFPKGEASPPGTLGFNFDDVTVRYPTWLSALRGHIAIVAKLRTYLELP